MGQKPVLSRRADDALEQWCNDNRDYVMFFVRNQGYRPLTQAPKLRALARRTGVDIEPLADEALVRVLASFFYCRQLNPRACMKQWHIPKSVAEEAVSRLDAAIAVHGPGAGIK